MLATTEWKASQWQEALATLELGIAHANETATDTRKERLPTAEKCVRQGLELANHQGAAMLELWCQVDLVRIRHARGESATQERQELASMMRSVTEDFDPASLAEAQQLLESLA